MSRLVEILCIIDQSGSMSGLESDTIGGYNKFLQSQKAIEDVTKVTTVLFNHQYEVIFNNENIDNALLNNRLYQPCGSTALLDAIGISINRTIKRINASELEMRPSQVIVVIITDGLENSSKEYSYHEIKRLIERQKAEYDWDFKFLGANIDVVAEGRKMGFAMHETKSYKSTNEGTRDMYASLCCEITDLRMKKANNND